MKWLGKVVLRLLCWTAALLAIVILLSQAMRIRNVDAPYNISQKVDGLYALKPDTVDVVFIGTSSTYFGFNPSLLWREYGIPAYTFASSEQPVFFSYTYAKEAIRTQHPRVIVLDVHTIRYTYDYARDAINHIALDDLPMNRNKLEAIFRFTPKEEWIEHLFPVVKYHGEGVVNLLNFSAPAEDPYLGYSPSFDLPVGMEYEIGENAEAAGSSPLAEREEEVFRELIALCREEGVQLMLIDVPSGLSVEDEERINAGLSIAQEEGIPFLNLNTRQWAEENQFDSRYDIVGTVVDHSNYKGSTKCTRAVGDYLSAELGLTDRRDDPAYADWNDKTRAYYTLFMERADMLDYALYLPKSDRLDMKYHAKDYLARLKDYSAEGYAILMSAYDESSQNADEEIDALLSDLGWQHPISKDYRCGHLFVSVDGQVIKSEMDTEQAMYFAYEDQSKGLELSVWSEGFGARLPAAGEGALAGVENIDDVRMKMEINGETFTITRGLNIVVYDIENQQVVDSANFDLYIRQFRSI